MMHWREDCLNRLTSSASSSQDVLAALSSIVTGLGFEYCSYVLRIPFPIATPKITWSSTYPQRWLEHYFNHGYLDVDPLIRQTARELSPVIWASDKAARTLPFWEEAHAHGICYGWALATHGRRMTTGMLSLARGQEEIDSSELDAKEPQLFWLSHIAHGLIAAIETRGLSGAGNDELTRREIEVLRWSAGGKTADEIATILGISARTVTFHITSSLVKLDAINKTQAVAKAFLLNLL